MCEKLGNGVSFCDSGMTVSTPRWNATRGEREKGHGGSCSLPVTQISPPPFLCHSKKARTASLNRSQVVLKALWTTQHINDLLFINCTYLKGQMTGKQKTETCLCQELASPTSNRTKARPLQSALGRSPSYQTSETARKDLAACFSVEKLPWVDKSRKNLIKG